MQICFHLRNIRSVRNMLTYDACSQLIHALATVHIDYCNSLLHGLPDKVLTDYKEMGTLLLVFFAEFLNF